jgi:ubiquinone biosynthesis protein UbiJ
MPETSTQPAGKAEPSALGKLAERGEETMRRLSQEIDKNPRMHDARDRFDKFGRSVLKQLNVALMDEVEELKKEVARLEKRLAKLEKEVAARASAKAGASGDA